MDRSALGGRRLTLTQQRAARLTERFHGLGAIVDRVPLTDVADPRDGGVALAAVLDRLGEFDWLLVTSVNGARRVGDAARRCRGVHLGSVGAATAHLLAELAGRPVDLVPSVQRVEGLLAEFPRDPSVVLAAQGDLASPALVDGLRASGHSVSAVEAYRTVARSRSDTELETLSAAHVVVLASGSAAVALAGVGGVSAAVVAIGPVTADAARDAGLSVAAVAASPADDDVVAAVADALASTDGT